MNVKTTSPSIKLQWNGITNLQSAVTSKLLEVLHRHARDEY